MAVDYDKFFDIAKIYGSAHVKTNNNILDIDASILHAMNAFKGISAQSDELRVAMAIYEGWASAELKFQNNFGNQLSKYLETDGNDVIQSAETLASSVASDLVLFMVRDSQTVLTNTISNNITYSRAGDGVVNTFIQSQQTQPDVITLSCITAQNGGDAVFTVRSQRLGLIQGATVTADGATSYVNPLLGITSLIVDEGTVSNEWVISDQIILETLSDDRSVLLTIFRDLYFVELPSNATPTISNTLVDVGTEFPSNPEDGDEFIIDGIQYIYSASDAEWIESCVT